MKFFINDSDGISEWYEVIICPGKVVSVYLLTDRNYVSKSAAILEFLYLLLTAWVEFRLSGIVHSTKVVNSRY